MSTFFLRRCPIISNKQTFGLRWLVSGIWALALLSACSEPAADIVFSNGRVYTVDANRSWAEAVAVRDGRIVFVGDSLAASEQIGRDTVVVDLRGRMMLPGMQDAHVHPIEGGLEDGMLLLQEDDDIGGYKADIAAYAAAHPDLPWIVGIGWEFSSFPPGVTPRRETLDELVPDRPVYISSYDEHASWVNTAALNMAGITKDTPDPAGGQILRDAESGEPSGTLQEEARLLVRKFLPPVTEQEKIAALRSSMQQFNAWGITAIQDASVDGGPELDVYAALEDAGELSLRVVAALRWYPERGLEQVDELRALRDRYESELIDAATAKIWMDGILENHTGAMLEPYLNANGSRGTPMLDPQELKAIVTRLDAAGFQAHFHAIGDAAVRYSLDAVEAAVKTNGQRHARHHIAHVQVVDPQDIPRFAELEVVANFQPLWAQADDYITELNIPAIGTTRARWIYPMASIQRAGGSLAFGSDWSVSTANPFPQIETAITRRASEGELTPEFVPEEGLDLASAIDAFTIDAAFVNKLEQVSGSIEVGKFADLIVIDQNVFEIEVHDISDTKVLLTLFGGRVVYGDLDELAL